MVLVPRKVAAWCHGSSAAAPDCQGAYCLLLLLLLIITNTTELINVNTLVKILINLQHFASINPIFFRRWGGMYKEKDKATDGTTVVRKEKQPCLTKCSMSESQQTSQLEK